MKHLEKELLVLKEMLRKKYCNHGICEKHSYPECGLTRGLLCPYDERPKEVQALIFFIEAYEQAGAELPEAKKVDNSFYGECVSCGSNGDEGNNAHNAYRKLAIPIWAKRELAHKTVVMRLLKLIEDIKESREGTCVHCGKLLGAKECDHWKTCTQHPANEEIARLRAENEELWKWRVCTPECQARLAEIKAEATKYKDKLASLEKRAEATIIEQKMRFFDIKNMGYKKWGLGYVYNDENILLKYYKKLAQAINKHLISKSILEEARGGKK